MVRTMSNDGLFRLSAFQWRGVWGERESDLGLGKGYCANLGHPEDETGLVYMRARYYEPATGRFISEDPSRDGVNWYLYADGNPVKWVDPEGKDRAPEVWIVVGYLAAAFAVVWGALSIEFIRDPSGIAILPALLATLAATFSVYAFFRGLGGKEAEWNLITPLGGIAATAIFKEAEASLEGLSRLGRFTGGLGLAAAAAGAGYILAVTAALLLANAI